MDNFAIRLYQSGKTRRRNANKKKQLIRYRQMLAKEQKQKLTDCLDLKPEVVMEADININRRIDCRNTSDRYRGNG